MGNKPAGRAIKGFFSDVGNRIESGTNLFVDKIVNPIAGRVSTTFNGVWDLGDATVGLGRNTIERAKNLEDSATDAAGGVFDGLKNVTQSLGMILPIMLGAGVLIVAYNMSSKNKG